jgi:hypothetical protein
MANHIEVVDVFSSLRHKRPFEAGKTRKPSE